MNVRLHDSAVHPECVAIFQAEIHRRVHHQLIDGFHRLRSQPMKGAVKRMMFGHRLAIEFRELAQRVSVGDAFPEFAIIPVLDALQYEERRTCEGVNPLRPVAGFLASFQIPSYRLDHLFVLIQKVGDALQQWFQRDALLEQLPIGETDLGFRSSWHSSVLLFFRRLISFSLQRF